MSDNGVAMFFIVIAILKITRALPNKKQNYLQVIDSILGLYG